MLVNEDGVDGDWDAVQRLGRDRFRHNVERGAGGRGRLTGDVWIRSPRPKGDTLSGGLEVRNGCLLALAGGFTGDILSIRGRSVFCTL